MNVAEADVMGLVNSVVNSMQEDGVKAEKVSVELTEAYVIHANKKMRSFSTTYMTNQEARKAFQFKVLSDIQAA
jgi:hypothetical protein